MIDELPINMEKSQAVTSLESDNQFKVNGIKPLNKKKEKCFIGLLPDVFSFEKEQDWTFIPILRFYELEQNNPIKDIGTN